MPMMPSGTETMKTARQSMTASRPPRIRPMNEPAIAAIWLMPSAMPRRSAGNASVRIAVEFANSIAAPTPWNTRQRISQSAPAPAMNGSSDSAIAPIVNSTKPAL